MFVRTVKKCKIQVAGIRQDRLLTDLDESNPSLVDSASAVEKIKWAGSQRSELFSLSDTDVPVPRHPTFPSSGSPLTRNGGGNDPFLKNTQGLNFQDTMCYFHPIFPPYRSSYCFGFFSFVTSPICFKIWLLMFCCNANISVEEHEGDCFAPVFVLFVYLQRGTGC